MGEIHLLTLFKPAVIFLISRTYVALEFFIPDDVLKKSYISSGLMTTVFSIFASATRICQHPLLKLIFEKYSLFSNC